MGYIPFLYSFLHSKLSEHSRNNVLNTWEFRKLLGEVMKIKKNNSMVVLHELEKMGLISYNKESETINIL